MLSSCYIIGNLGVITLGGVTVTGTLGDGTIFGTLGGPIVGTSIGTTIVGVSPVAWCEKVLPQKIIITGLSTTYQANNASKELIQVLKYPGPKPPFTIGESQLHAIY